MTDKLQQAITAIKSGDKKTGQQLLAEVIKSDPGNENAWLWMSDVVEHDENRLYCLRQVLLINPNNQIAKKGLAILRDKKKDEDESSKTPEKPEAAVAKIDSTLSVKDTSRPKQGFDQLKNLGRNVSQRMPKTIILLLVVYVWSFLRTLGRTFGFESSVDYHLFDRADVGFLFFVYSILGLIFTGLTVWFLWQPRPVGFWIAISGLGLEVIFTFVGLFIGLGNPGTLERAYALSRSARGLHMRSEMLDFISSSLGILLLFGITISWNLLIAAAFYWKRDYFFAAPQVKNGGADIVKDEFISSFEPISKTILEFWSSVQQALVTSMPRGRAEVTGAIIGALIGLSFGLITGSISPLISTFVVISISLGWLIAKAYNPNNTRSLILGLVGFVIGILVLCPLSFTDFGFMGLLIIPPIICLIGGMGIGTMVGRDPTTLEPILAFGRSMLSPLRRNPGQLLAGGIGAFVGLTLSALILYLFPPIAFIVGIVMFAWLVIDWVNFNSIIMIFVGMIGMLVGCVLILFVSFATGGVVPILVWLILGASAGMNAGMKFGRWLEQV
jgi:hypothetical protein